MSTAGRVAGKACRELANPSFMDNLLLQVDRSGYLPPRRPAIRGGVRVPRKGGAAFRPCSRGPHGHLARSIPELQFTLYSAGILCLPCGHA